MGKDLLFKTARLCVRPLEEADAQDVYDYRVHPDVLRFQSFWPDDVASMRQWLSGSAPFGSPGRWSQLGVECGGELVGDLGVHVLGDSDAQVEFGVTINPKQHRQGFGFEAVEGLLSHLFEGHGKHRVFAMVDPDNVASMGLMRKVGMRQEGHMRKSYWFRDRWVDDVIFAVLAEEWSVV